MRQVNENSLENIVWRVSGDTLHFISCAEFPSENSGQWGTLRRTIPNQVEPKLFSALFGEDGLIYFTSLVLDSFVPSTIDFQTK